MKLKKIASLALAGLMAVSTLAACGGSTTGDNGANGGNGPVQPATSSIITALNNGQSKGNTVKVDFKVDSDLDAALAVAVKDLGADAEGDMNLTNLPYLGAGNVSQKVSTLTGIRTNKAGDAYAAWNVNSNLLTYGTFLDGTFDYKDQIAGNYGRVTENQKGKTYTMMVVARYDGHVWLDEAAVLNDSAVAVNELLKDLAKTSLLDAGDVKGDKYYSYDYDGSASMVTRTNIDGTTDYFVAYVVNQNVSEKTLEK